MRRHHGTDRRLTVRLGAVLFSSLILAAAGCQGDGASTSASVSFDKLQKYQSQFGVFDAPEFTLGDVLEIDTAAKVGSRILGIAPTKNDTTTTTPIDSSAITTNLDVKVAVDATLGSADAATVTAAISSYASSSTYFVLKNFRRVNLNDPGQFTTSNSSAFARVKEGLAASQPKIYLVVSGLVRADDAQLKMKDSTGASVSVNVIKAGKFNVTVNYSANATLTQAAKQGAIFFKVDQLDLNAAKNGLLATSNHLDLSTIDFTTGRKK